MKNLVQKSMKIDKETDEKIKALVVKSRYWKYNAVVNSLLGVMTDGMQPDDLLEVLRFSRDYGHKKPVIKIEWLDKTL